MRYKRIFMNNKDSFKAYYNEIEICEKSADAHFRAAIQIRNRYMIDRSDLAVCYVERKVGGAYNALQYANKISTLLCPMYEPICTNRTFWYQISQKKPDLSKNANYFLDFFAECDIL